MASTGNVAMARQGIRALETLTTVDNRTASEAEREVLRQWPGWGPLAPAFDPTPD